MKTLTYTLALTIALSGQLFAQDKKEMKKLEKEYAAFTGHKKFFKTTEWAMCKFTVVYKLTTAMTTIARDKSTQVRAKVKSTSGAYGMLAGVSEADLQKITDNVAKKFMERMKTEAGVDITTWSTFKDSKNTAKLVSKQEDRELYSKSQGLAYAMSYDETPHYNRVIALIPGGKKIAKELKRNVAEFTLYVDFADALATAHADVSVTGSSTHGNTTTTYFTISEGGNQKIYPGIRIVRNLGSQSAIEMATSIGTTGVKGHNEIGNIFYVGLVNDVASSLPFVDKVEVVDGEVPEILKNRRNNKIEYTRTFQVYTTPERYGAAVLDAAKKYFDTVIKIYNNAKGQ
jgi:hypothetical protein